MCTYYYLKRLLHEQQLVDERREVHLVRAQDREELRLCLGVGLLVVRVAADLEARVVDVVVQGVVVRVLDGFEVVVGPAELASPHLADAPLL